MAPKPKIRDGSEAVEPGAEAREDALLDLSREEIRRRAYEIYLGAEKSLAMKSRIGFGRNGS
jgi:hypothetical protein